MGRVYFKKIRNKDGKISYDAIRLRIRSFLYGYGGRMGFVKTFLTYGLLCIFGFVYLYPILYMIATSFKSLNDLVDTTVNWIPKEFTPSNYKQAFVSLTLPPNTVFGVLKDSILLAIVPSIGQIITCSLAGYALQRFRFPGKKLIFTILVITFILPQQVVMPSTYQILLKYDLIGTMAAFFVPAFLGQGLKSAILILIFYQFFKTIPRVLDEAAQIDGAGYFKIFYKIGIRAASPAYIVSFLLSVVWYWNETYLTNIYMGNATKSARNITTLLLQLRNFAFNFEMHYGQNTSLMAGSYSEVNEAIKSAAVLITLVPILVLYFIMQKYFVEGVEKTGITGE